MIKRRMVVRTFKCPYCEARMPATKMARKATGFGHIKTMHCYKCKQNRDFVQIDSN